jgi:16S rRNA (cytidine1402-2'-O)-methyltransferase
MQQCKDMMTQSTLYVVATPIGNLRDISLRALDVLASVGVIAAEDTRTTRHLLAHHSLSVKMMALHQHNERAAAEKVISLLQAGQSVALVTDAGTPGVSDPGAILVELVREQGFRVTPIPGANAAVCALSASGITEPHFLFYGFLPTKTSARKRALEALTAQPHTLIFYEAPHRILECITDLAAVMGAHRRITIARELTKLFETIHHCDLGDALVWLKADANQQKGEFVLLISGAEVQKESEISVQSQHTLEILLEDLPLKQAVQLAADITGESRKVLYALALSLKEESSAQ